MRIVLIMLAAAAVLGAQSRPRDIAFRIQMIDPGWSETAAVADFDNDGRLDVLSADAWYRAPAWTRQRIRDINFTAGYVDNFSDLPVDVDGDGYMDVVQFGYFDPRIVWLKNPGKGKGPWVETEIERIGPTEFAFLVDLTNDGKAVELLPQFTRAANAPLGWYELQNGKWVRRVVTSQTFFGHGIGAGDMNGDGRNDILTPTGWLEAPPDVRAPGNWTFHAADWNQLQVAVGPAAAGLPVPPSAPAAQSSDGPAARPRAAGEFGFMYPVDINKDGRQDVLTTMAHSYGLLWIEQGAGGGWTQRMIDNMWSQAHASALADMNGDGQLDLVTGKRYNARSAPDPTEREPLGVYWYEHRKLARPPAQPGAVSVEWIRHIIDYGGRAGGGLQLVVRDMDGDGDQDVVTGGKSGLFLAENLSRSPVASGRR
jgi:hypothetical protein